MPTASEIAKYVKAAVLFKSGRPKNWPPSGTGIASNHEYYVEDRVHDARNAYRGETKLKLPRKGTKEVKIPLNHATGILEILRRWAGDLETQKSDNYQKAGLTSEAIELASTALLEDFADES